MDYVEAFRNHSQISTLGSAMAWLAHIGLLQFVIQSNFGSALILEDDQDWSVNIRMQMVKVREAILELTHGTYKSDLPYGDGWDVIWLGHCSDPPDTASAMISFSDDTVAPPDSYQGLDKHVSLVVEAGHRVVHFSVRPVCSWAYVVSYSGARALLELATSRKDDAFDLMMMRSCQERVIRCVTVNPPLFSEYHPSEGDESEVGAGNEGIVNFSSRASNKKKGHTDNVLQSARCKGLFNTNCFDYAE